MKQLIENMPAYLIGADYSGHRKAIRLIFYSPDTSSLLFWCDDSHSPYCLTNLSPFDLEKIKGVMTHPSFKSFEVITKYDALNDKNINVTKIITEDPKAIGGGSPKENIRDIIPDEMPDGKVWEAKVTYECCYCYDKQIEMGMPYKLLNGRLVPVIYQDAEDRIKEIAEKTGIKNDRWIRLFEYPVPDFLRTSLDIEVLGESRTRVPNPRKAEYPIVSATLIGSDGRRHILLLLRQDVEVGEDEVNGSMQFFDKEADLIKTIFVIIRSYPFTITFNGDNFDLTYIYNRAVRLGIQKEEIPLDIHHNKVQIKDGIHIDLYRFFFNKSIKNYAFQGKYKSITLDDIATALLGKGKLHTDKDIWLATEMPKWSYTQLAKYNCQDADITLELTTYSNAIVMKLLVALMRISVINIEDLSRIPISQWIRGMIFNELRRRNILIPNPSDIIEFPNKGTMATKAVIKGKKYKGAIVVEPISGIHFNIKVVDFASLYPSIMKTRNLGYATINCSHEECRKNAIVPETSHYICTKNRAVESELIGLMRDLRIKWYKKKKKESEWYSVIEQAIKVILNASYGVFGNEEFSLYCPPVSESITALGRHSITSTIDKAKELNIIVLYGDTDSIFLKNPSAEQLAILIKWCEENLDLDLEVDKAYRYVCLSSRKKNYLGVTPTGEIDIKGMSGKKKHVPTIIKGAFDVAMEYLAKAQTPEEIEAIKKSLKEVIKDIYYRIKKRDFELEEMAFSMTLGKSISAYETSIPQHVRAAQILKDKTGISLDKGDSISFVKTLDKEGVKPLELAKKEEINITKYHEMLKSTFEQILDSLNVSYDDIIGIKSLDAFT